MKETREEPIDQPNRRKVDRSRRFNPVRSHEGLIVWQKALDLVASVYKLCEALPAKEEYGITAQMKRAVTSVPANIAEGNGRFTKRAYGGHLSIARGSLMETQSFLAIAVRVGFLSQVDVELAFALIRDIDTMLTALRTSLELR